MLGFVYGLTQPSALSGGFSCGKRRTKKNTYSFRDLISLCFNDASIDDGWMHVCIPRVRESLFVWMRARIHVITYDYIRVYICLWYVSHLCKMHLPTFPFIEYTISTLPWTAYVCSLRHRYLSFCSNVLFVSVFPILFVDYLASFFYPSLLETG